MQEKLENQISFIVLKSFRKVLWKPVLNDKKKLFYSTTLETYLTCVAIEYSTTVDTLLLYTMYVWCVSIIVAEGGSYKNGTTNTFNDSRC